MEVTMSQVNQVKECAYHATCVQGRKQACQHCEVWQLCEVVSDQTKYIIINLQQGE